MQASTLTTALAFLSACTLFMPQLPETATASPEKQDYRAINLCSDVDKCWGRMTWPDTDNNFVEGKKLGITESIKYGALFLMNPTFVRDKGIFWMYDSATFTAEKFQSAPDSAEKWQSERSVFLATVTGASEYCPSDFCSVPMRVEISDASQWDVESVKSAAQFAVRDSKKQDTQYHWISGVTPSATPKGVYVVSSGAWKMVAPKDEFGELGQVRIGTSTEIKGVTPLARIVTSRSRIGTLEGSPMPDKP